MVNFSSLKHDSDKKNTLLASKCKISRGEWVNLNGIIFFFNATSISITVNFRPRGDVGGYSQRAYNQTINKCFKILFLNLIAFLSNKML